MCATNVCARHRASRTNRARWVLPASALVLTVTASALAGVWWPPQSAEYEIARPDCPQEVWQGYAGPVVEPIPEPHNCRLYGAIGSDLPDGSLGANLLTDTYSLHNLSATANIDGWGIAYYPDFGSVATFERGPIRAANDPDFDTAVGSIDASEPAITLAHIRLCTSKCCVPGEELVPDPHPFYHTFHGQTWSFEHNGGVSRTRLWGDGTGDGGLLDEDFLAANPPNCSGVEFCAPCYVVEDGVVVFDEVVDSELYFLYVMQEIEAHGWNVPAGIAAAVNAMIDDGEGGGMNFLLSNGENLWAFRKGGAYYSLHYYWECGYAAVASQVPDPAAAGWLPLSSLDLLDMTSGEVIAVDEEDFAEQIVDCAFEDSADSAALRANGGGQDWYESINNVPTILTLDTADIGGNATKKAALKNYGVAGRACLTQEFTEPQTDFVQFECDMYIDRIEDRVDYDRTAAIFIGDDHVSIANPPCGTANERFVCLSFYDPTPGAGDDDLELRARTEVGQSYTVTSQWTELADDLSYDTWYRVRVVLDVPNGTYNVYLNDILVGHRVPKYPGYNSNSVSHVSFWADSMARGDFYVDGVYATTYNAPPPSITGTITWPNGMPAPYVTVLCRSLHCNGSWEVLTDENGYYEFDVPADVYEIRASRRAVCTSYVRNDCPLTYNGCDPLTVDLQLVANGGLILCPMWICDEEYEDRDFDFEDAPAKDDGGVGEEVRYEPGVQGVIHWNCGVPLEVAPYVEVKAKVVCMPTTYTVQADENGYFWLPLPEGRYNLSAKIRINGTWYYGLACGVVVDGPPETRNMTLRTVLPYVCADCEIADW